MNILSNACVTEVRIHHETVRLKEAAMSEKRSSDDTGAARGYACSLKITRRECPSANVRLLIRRQRQRLVIHDPINIPRQMSKHPE